MNHWRQHVSGGLERDGVVTAHLQVEVKSMVFGSAGRLPIILKHPRSFLAGWPPFGESLFPTFTV
jgi:hypothetical protein